MLPDAGREPSSINLVGPCVESAVSGAPAVGFEFPADAIPTSKTDVVVRRRGPDENDKSVDTTFFNRVLDQASLSCPASSVEGGDRPAISQIPWHGINLVDVRSCTPDTSSSAIRASGYVHNYYMPDGRVVATYDAMTGETTYSMSPLAVLMRAMGKCR
jgi:hypothetical protein